MKNQTKESERMLTDENGIPLVLRREGDEDTFTDEQINAICEIIVEPYLEEQRRLSSRR